MTLLLWIVAVVLVLAGIAGTVLPALPGGPLVFVGLLFAAWAGGFERVGWGTLMILGVLALLSIGVDFLSTSLGAKRVGASKAAIIGAMVGTIVGLFFGFVGLLLGPFIGAVIGELATRRDVAQAGKAGLGTWLGLVLGRATNLALVFVMIGIFVAAYLW
ncbi:MAG TPA: DUF456 domain-containing protein [Blastocatellia bacterium]|nr:DUF456 domain-containing protein [Blastocatellia bacterium]